MKTIFGILLCIALVNMSSGQDIYMTPNASLSFFSSTSIEDIDAYSTQAVAALNIKSKLVFFKVPMKSFTFKKELMQQHFNENYVESDKYPYATFSGIIADSSDLSKDGYYHVTVNGKLNIHGVEQNRTVSGILIVKDGKIDITTEFDVKIADHKIKIPTIVSEHIAESVHVKVHALLAPVADK